MDLDVAELSPSISLASASADAASAELASSGARLWMASRSRVTASTTDDGVVKAFSPVPRVVKCRTFGEVPVDRFVRGRGPVAAAVLWAFVDRPVLVVVAEVPVAVVLAAVGTALAARDEVLAAAPAPDVADFDLPRPLPTEPVVRCAVPSFGRRATPTPHRKTVTVHAWDWSPFGLCGFRGGDA